MVQFLSKLWPGAIERNIQSGKGIGDTGKEVTTIGIGAGGRCSCGAGRDFCGGGDGESGRGGGDVATGEALEKIWFCDGFCCPGGRDGWALGGEFAGIVFFQLKIECVREVQSCDVGCVRKKVLSA